MCYNEIRDQIQGNIFKMIETNIAFQEEYKRLDALCKDIFSSKEGISEYIREMESVPWNERRFISSWETDYKQLKHMRWVRNQLAHEVGTLNAELCNEEDICWLTDFYRQIINLCDPLATLSKFKNEQTKRINQARVQEPVTVERHEPAQNHPKRDSFWNKITAKIKKLFFG